MISVFVMPQSSEFFSVMDPRKVGRRIVHTKRHEKQVSGHPIQVDVKFLSFIDENAKKLKCYQYTFIDDVKRVRALKIYARHTQKNAIRFIDHIIKNSPIRIHIIRTDRRHEF